MQGRLRERRRGLFVAAAVLSLAAVGIALVTQTRFDMQPCAWCVLQRAIFVAIAGVALLGALLDAVVGGSSGNRPVPRLLSAGLMLLLAGCGAAAALWQHFVAASSTSCAMTLADRVVRGAGLDELWPLGFSATASCAEAAVRIAGVPYEFFSLLLFVLLGAMALLLLRQLPGRRR